MLPKCFMTASALAALTLGPKPAVFAVGIAKSVVKTPPYCELAVSYGIAIPSPEKKDEFKIYYLNTSLKQLVLTVTDPFGVSVAVKPRREDAANELTIVPEIITVPSANPVSLPAIPRLCPRVTIKPGPFPGTAVYDAGRDLLNRRPSLQLADPDSLYYRRQRDFIGDFDGTNTLKVTRVKISYDYEDTAILDYDGPHPLTGKPGHKVFEGDGGFYANFHYAVVPFAEHYLTLARQELLHLAQGRLDDINRLDLQPELRAHSFLPGPYLSTSQVYDMCEWGDTAHQAPVQELHYKNLAIWDWDIVGKNGVAFEKLLLIVWEGDEEAWMVADGLLDPYYLTDDVAGVFVLEKTKTAEPLVLVNERGDFELEVGTVR